MINHIKCLYTVNVALGPYDWLASRILPKRYRNRSVQHILFDRFESREQLSTVMVKRAFMYRGLITVSKKAVCKNVTSHA